VTNILAIVILTGASCVSHVGHSEALRVTTASKVPCAVVIRAPVGNPFKAAQQPNTITPAATAPAFKYPPKKKAKKKRKARR
jgi:hypothetical protein